MLPLTRGIVRKPAGKMVVVLYIFFLFCLKYVFIKLFFKTVFVNDEKIALQLFQVLKVNSNEVPFPLMKGIKSRNIWNPSINGKRFRN